MPGSLSSLIGGRFFANLLAGIIAGVVVHEIIKRREQGNG